MGKQTHMLFNLRKIQLEIARIKSTFDLNCKMISVLIDRAKKMQDLVNRLNRFNKLICDSNHQLEEKTSCLDEDSCEKKVCVVNEFQKKNERLKMNMIE